MASCFRWCFDEGEEISVCTDDGVALQLLCGPGPDGSPGLELVPRFRYRVRVAPLRPHAFQAEAARALFQHALLLLPCARDPGGLDDWVTEVVVLSFSPKLVRIAHGQSLESPPEPARPAGGGDETAAASQLAWTTQTYYRHPRRGGPPPPPRPQQPCAGYASSKRDSNDSGSSLEMPPCSLNG